MICFSPPEANALGSSDQLGSGPVLCGLNVRVSWTVEGPGMIWKVRAGSLVVGAKFLQRRQPYARFVPGRVSRKVLRSGGRERETAE